MARAEITSEQWKGEVIETKLQDGGIERRLLRDLGQRVYRSAVTPLADGFEVKVLEGHPSQRSSFRVQGGRPEVRDGSGEVLGTETLRDLLCLPALFDKFGRSHGDRLSQGSAPLRCMTPIIKATKMAPLHWRRKPEGSARRFGDTTAEP